jgi:acyl carrier protein
MDTTALEKRQEADRLSDDRVRSEVREFVGTHILYSDGGYPYDDDTSFLREAIVDSMGIFELVTFVQTRFGIQASREEVVPENFDSISRIAAFVLRKRAGSGSSSGAAGSPQAPPGDSFD